MADNNFNVLILICLVYTYAIDYQCNYSVSREYIRDN